MKGYDTHFKCNVVFANECMEKKTRIPSVDGGDYPVWEGPVYCQQVLIWKYELMSSFVESGGGL